MKSVLKYLGGIGFVVVAAAGCVTIRPTPEARGVRLVYERSVVAHCQMIDEVSGGQYAPVIGAVEHTIDNARTRIREGAAQKGANVILVTERTANVYGTWMHGEAYDCPGH